MMLPKNRSVTNTSIQTYCFSGKAKLRSPIRSQEVAYFVPMNDPKMAIINPNLFSVYRPINGRMENLMGRSS